MKLFTILSVSILALGAVGLVSTCDAQTKRTSKKRTKPKPKPKPVVKVNPALVPFAGTWYPMDAEGKFQKANRFVLTGAGGFKYIGPGWTSEGTFTAAPGFLNFSWTKIDGAAVKPGSVKKAFPLADDKKSFQLDRFKYGKAS